MEPIPTPPDLFAIADADSFTVDNAAAMLAVLFFMPGDWLLWSVLTYAPPAARLLGIGASDFGGPLSASISAFVWAASFVFSAITYRAIRDFDEALTGSIVKGWNDARTRIRVARRLVVYRLREVGKPRTAAAAHLVLDAEELILDDDALKLIRALAGPRAAHGLPLRDAAMLIGRGKRDARRVLERLKTLQLARAARKSADGDIAYVLTPAGRGFLLFKQLAPNPAAAAR